MAVTASERRGKGPKGRILPLTAEGAKALKDVRGARVLGAVLEQ